ncbi:MAG: Putative uracil-DNA glycosylase protein [Candidatus Tokpelaia hoelldobleri]|uniref:Uracil-DNA glycosylase protein n=1 Tax=Candidatus Tokpelaia hoelldobleri TaxID=1902579 RepID=A0A1U9JV69_9HYPH|nr:MAG: Putative uracil-DNA glycosylase protein [Candidatus Tokpelaia hoelldoblerii]
MPDTTADTFSLASLDQQIKACRLCREAPRCPPPLPHEPRPVCILSASAHIAIAGQAPGMRVHETGIPFNDPSGNRLRNWLGVDRATFYNPAHFAIVPMGFCFPGYDAKGGDLPPRRECATLWHEAIFNAMPQIRLVLAIGQYAQRWHIAQGRQKNLTETVKNWRDILSRKQPRGYHVLPLPHPSWRNTAWLGKNPWFEEELLPELRQQIHAATS